MDIFSELFLPKREIHVTPEKHNFRIKVGNGHEVYGVLEYTLPFTITIPSTDELKFDIDQVSRRGEHFVIFKAVTI